MTAPKGWDEAQAFQSKTGTNPQKKGVAIPAGHDSPELREHAIKYLKDAGCRDIVVYENINGFLIVVGERDVVVSTGWIGNDAVDVGYLAGLDIKEPDNVPCSNG